MSYRNAVRTAFVFCYSIALGACSGQNLGVPGGPSAGTAGTMAHSWIDLRSKPKEILYVSDPSLGVVNLYDASREDGRPIGQLADFRQPEGLFVDSSKDIWVANFGSRDVLGFREGSLFPFFELSDTSGHPNGLCNQAYSPTFYVVNAESANGGPGQTVDVYANESRKPTSVLTDANAANLLACAVNSKGDLFVTMETASNAGEIDEFPKGKTSPVVLIKNLNYPGGIVFDDRDYLVVSEAYAGTIRIFAPPYGKGPKDSFQYDGSILQIAFDASATHLWAANQSLVAAQEYSYPGGVLENETQLENLFHPAGVAVSPPELH
jgi:hypothetical protein